MQPKFKRILYGGDYNPNQWPEEIWKEDMRIFKDARINSATINVFSWAKIQPSENEYNFSELDKVVEMLSEENYDIVFATSTAALPGWMVKKYPEVMYTDYEGRQHRFGQRHNACPNSLVYRKYARALADKLAERYASNPHVTCWHVNNEYGITCFCDNCQNAFRVWLKDKYKTIDALNKAWNMEFWGHTVYDWDDVVVPNALSEGIGTEKTAFAGISIDYRRFNSDSVLECYKMERDAIRSHNADVVITTNLMGTFKDLDYFKWAKEMDIVSWDNYPSWHKKDEYTTAVDGAMQHDLMRSIRKAPFLLMESCPSATNWKPINKLKKPGMHLAASLQAVAHGSDSVLYFQLRQSQGASEKFHGAVIDHYGGDDTRVFREVTEVGEALEQIREIVGSEIKCQAAVLYDRENDWALKDAQGPRNEDMHYQECVQKQYRALRRKGCNTDIITMEHDLSDYKLVTVPMAYMFYHGYAEKLCTFAENGGTLVISYWSGLVDETDKCYLEGTPHGLMEAAGIRTEEIDALYDWEENHGIPETGNHLGITKSYTCKNLCELAKVSDAEVMMRYSEDFYQGYPVLTHKKYGKGHVYYVAADMEAAFYEDFLGRAADEAGVDTPLDFVPEGVSVTTRETEDTEYLFIQNFAGKTETVSVSEEYEVIYGTDSENMSPLQTRILKRKK